MKLRINLCFLVIPVFILCFHPVFSADKSRKLREIEAKSQNIRKKIEETKQKEKVAIGKLTEIQKRLYKTQNVLRKNKLNLTNTQNNIELTEGELSKVKQSYSGLKIDAEERIRQIYQGQRLKILEMLLRTTELADLLDLLYYQKLLIAQDKKLLEELNKESSEIIIYKDRLAEQKIQIANIVSSIEEQRREIAKEHSSQSSLVYRLKTERQSYEQAERELERDSQKLISEINKLVGRGSLGGYSLPGSGLFS